MKRQRFLSVRSQCSLCLCGKRLLRKINHRDAEPTEAHREKGFTLNLPSARFLPVQNIASFNHAGWIDGCVSFVDVTNDALFVDHESGAIAEALLFVKDSVVLHHGSFEITQ